MGNARAQAGRRPRSATSLPRTGKIRLGANRRERFVSLFVAKHQHSAEVCPAKDPEMGAMLLEHLSDESAARQGISIHGEAVIEGQHTLYLIAEAPARAALEGFLAPFAMAGAVEVLEANPCSTVVDRARC